MHISASHGITLAVCLLAILGVMFRPGRVSEAVWAVGGAVALVVLGLLPASAALHAIGRGVDVYLFLIGMMLLSELARREGLFAFLADFTVYLARGSARRLFFLVYALGTVVTVFMSNDATAVVLTPAVFAVATKAQAKPLPYLLACAFVANAASFVLPVSNPANLVLFASQPPPLVEWLSRFAPPSLASVVATFIALRFLFRGELAVQVRHTPPPASLERSGMLVALGIAFTAVALLIASGIDARLGLPTCVAAALVASAVSIAERKTPWEAVGAMSWSILPLVAGLFVMVQGVEQTAIVATFAEWLRVAAARSQVGAAWGAGSAIGIACNLVNNLPAGLLASSVLESARASALLRSAVTIGVDLGSNLSVTGSLATILWLFAIRREGADIGTWQFVRLGVVVMPFALGAALAALLL